jgi:FSR family fosmidomycin resistance protein-like MFS transporter
MKGRSVAALAISHVASDLNQGALPAMLPLLIAQRHFSYEVAAYLVMAISGTSSLLQPAFGWLTDRRPSPWLAPAGVLLAGTAMALAGIAPSEPWLIASAAVSGFGLAAFHPEAARLTHYVSGNQRGLGMSLFTVGGNLGFAIGPLLILVLLSWLGLPGSVFLAIPAALMASILSLELRRVPRAAAGRASIRGQRGAPNEWRPFTLLTLAVVTRSIVFFGLNTFLPLYWMNVFHVSRDAGSSALSIFLFAGASGTIIGGRLGDRFPRHRVVTISMTLVLPFLLALVLTRNSIAATALLIPMAISLFTPFSLMVVLGQEYLPRHLGIASGLMFGFAGTVGGIAAPLFGMLADRTGLPSAFFALFLLACVAPALTFFLPAPGSARPEVYAEQVNAGI